MKNQLPPCRVEPNEYETITAKADRFFNGNVSALIREATLNYEPKTEHIWFEESVFVQCNTCDSVANANDLNNGSKRCLYCMKGIYGNYKIKEIDKLEPLLSKKERYERIKSSSLVNLVRLINKRWITIDILDVKEFK